MSATASERLPYPFSRDIASKSRYLLSSQLRRENARSRSGVLAYAVDHRLNLWSNFTYFLDDPIRGDQFEQEDKRRVYGFKASHALLSTSRGGL